jgi:hypothetical protein
MRRRSETEENEGNEDLEFFRRDFVLFVIFCSSLFRVVVRAKVREREAPGRPTGRMPVLRNTALEKHCPESVCSFVVLIKNEINNDEAKYEHADNDTGKTRESSWLLQGRAPKRRDSGLDCSKRNPGAAAEVSSVSCRLSDDGNRNQYFCCGGHESASVPRCRVR